MMLKNILVWYDDKNKSFRQLGLRGLPTTILISPNPIIMVPGSIPNIILSFFEFNSIDRLVRFYN